MSQVIRYTLQEGKVFSVRPGAVVARWRSNRWIYIRRQKASSFFSMASRISVIRSYSPVHRLETPLFVLFTRFDHYIYLVIYHISYPFSTSLSFFLDLLTYVGF